MLNARTMLAAVVTASLWPVADAYAADISTSSISDLNPQQQRAPQQSLGVRAPEGRSPEGRSLGLRLGRYGLPSLTAIDSVFSEPADRYGYERAPGDARADELRSLVEPGIDLSRYAPAAVPPKLGWGWSGRLGPLRWLGPLDGEGETRLRLGGRVSGQPQMSGSRINIGIHYTFE